MHYWDGSEVSPSHLLEDRIAQRQIDFQSLEPSGLIQAHPSIILPPSALGLLRNRQLAVHFAHRAALALRDLCLSQLPDNLLWTKPLLLHSYLPILISSPILTHPLDRFSGGRSEVAMGTHPDRK